MKNENLNERFRKKCVIDYLTNKYVMTPQGVETKEYTHTYICIYIYADF